MSVQNDPKDGESPGEDADGTTAERLHEIACEGLDTARNKRLGIARGQRFGDHFWAFGKDEKRSLDAVVAGIESYLTGAESKPYSVAVFGPPGSGKSFVVKQLAKEITKRPKDGNRVSLGKMVTLNLTQFVDSTDLGRGLAEALGLPDPGGAVDPPAAETTPARLEDVPFIFFDEFDAKGLSWLSWFLAPLNDGEFRRGGEVVEIGRAVFVFAGGTAFTAADFVGRVDAAFRTAKGPDFASRLRATFDVPGPNVLDADIESQRSLRRALIIHSQLVAKAKELDLESLSIEQGFLEQLLDIDRYTHGSRSISLLMNSLSRPGESTTVDQTWLSKDGRLAAYFDRGRLDPALLGGPVQLSGGADASKQADMAPVWLEVARRLFAEGASIFYGGLVRRERNLTSLLAELTLARKPLPRHPDTAPKPTEPVRLRVFGEAPEDPEDGLRYVSLSTMASPWKTLDGRNAPAELVGAVDLFCKRLHMARQSVACVAIGGKTEGWSGRMPGLLEELVLAALHGRPLYLIGGSNLAVTDLGRLLGLSDTWAGTPAWLRRPGALDAAAEQQADVFRWPGAEDAPLTTRDAVRTLRRFALGSPGWIPNGLSPAENRELFALAPLPIAGLEGEAREAAEARREAEAKRAAELIAKGLGRIARTR